MAKKETVERLLKSGHINFDEALELMRGDQVIIKEYIPYKQLQHTSQVYSNYNQIWFNHPQLTC